MMRLAPVAAVMLLAGCASPLVADAHFEGITTEEATFVVFVPRVSGYGAFTVEATAIADGVEWAALRDVDYRIGVSRRAHAGAIELSLQNDYYQSLGCDPRGCLRSYVVSLDEAPSAPWDLVVSVIVDGDVVDDGRIEILDAL
jgi:uncharacterized lipoprotein YmbA